MDGVILMERLLRIANEWNELETDTARFKYLLSHTGSLGLMLDNDETYPFFLEGVMPNGVEVYDHKELDLEDFDSYLGWSGSVFDLLEIIGVTVESV